MIVMSRPKLTAPALLAAALEAGPAREAAHAAPPMRECRDGPVLLDPGRTNVWRILK
jgi:hypothetical protein